MDDDYEPRRLQRTTFCAKRRNNSDVTSVFRSGSSRLLSLWGGLFSQCLCPAALRPLQALGALRAARGRARVHNRVDDWELVEHQDFRCVGRPVCRKQNGAVPEGRREGRGQTQAHDGHGGGSQVDPNLKGNVDLRWPSPSPFRSALTRVPTTWVRASIGLPSSPDTAFTIATAV